MQKSSYLQLSSFYFFFFATLGIFVPFWSLHLKSLGFTAAEIGELIAIVMGSKIISPYLLSWFSDHIGKRLVIIQASMLFSLIIFAGVLPFQSYWWFVAVMAGFGFFWNSSLPLFEALTLNHIADDTSRYSHIRLWGSVGFIVVVIVLPPLIEGQNISRLPIFILALLFANTVASFFVKDKPVASISHNPIHIAKTLKNPIVIALLLACSLQSLSHGAYYTFFTIYLEDHGYSRNVAGWMWALGVFAEVIIFMLMRPLLNYFSVCRLFAIALFITSIRWVMLAFWVDNLFLLLLAQLFHAGKFWLISCNCNLSYT